MAKGLPRLKIQLGCSNCVIREPVESVVASLPFAMCAVSQIVPSLNVLDTVPD